MRLSLFTPTHQPHRLARLAFSVADQTHDDFEWVVVPNGGPAPADVERVLGELPDDVVGRLRGRTRVVAYDGSSPNIGAIKQFCCRAAVGEVLVEADHDDELTPDCLGALAATFADPRVDFAYSNFAEVAGGRPHTYGASAGWEYRPFRWKGQTLQEAVAFDPSPAAFSKIWYAPNHVRAWRAAFYHAIGGHDPAFDVLDDQDLLARTYLRGHVTKIDRCLYVYHYTGANTSKGEKNDRIQRLCLALHDHYIEALVGRWCDLEGLAKVDLLGGPGTPPGYARLGPGGEIDADPDRPSWPLGDGSVGLVRAVDALGRLGDPVAAMAEIGRVLAPNGWLLSLTPWSDAQHPPRDPGQRSHWNAEMLRPLARSRPPFQLNRVAMVYPSPWHEQHRDPFLRADLLKYEGRTPGPVEA